MKFDDVVVGMCLSCMNVSYMCIFYAFQCLYVVIHAFSWLWLCMYGRLDMHCEVIVCN